MNIILLGAPNTGKGTLSENLKQKYDFIQISTGNMLREEVASGSELGLEIKQIIEAGNLVPDEIMIELIKKTTSNINKNIIFDGFPRTINQAEALKSIVSINAVLSLSADLDVIMERALGRLTCEKCGYVTHKKYGFTSCPKCGGNLITRADDTAETVKNRMKTYWEKTAPLIDYYKNCGILFNINAGINPEDTLEQASKVLESL